MSTPAPISMTRWRRIYYLVPVIALVIPFLANEYLLWIVNAILVYVLVTVGFNLIIGNLGQLAFPTDRPCPPYTAAHGWAAREHRNRLHAARALRVETGTVPHIHLHLL